MQYHVSWMVDIESESAEDAAFEARKLMREHETPTLCVRDDDFNMSIFEFEKEVITHQTPGHA